MTTGSPDILDALPHRPPFRFLSEVLSLETGKSGEALWRVSEGESFLTGHFPGQPIVPGVLITEALAQLSGLVGFHVEASKHAPAVGDAAPGKLAHVDVRFNESVTPPAAIVLKSRQIRVAGNLHQFDVEARWKETVVARGRLTLAGGLAPSESES